MVVPQDIRKRRGQHVRKYGAQHGRELQLWYVLLADQARRAELQGELIQGMSASQFSMLSVHDAARARRK